jgi:hypothetical protein
MQTAHVEVAESTLPDGSHQFVWKEGYLQVKRVAPGVIFMRKVGDYHDDVFHTIIKPFNSEWNATKHLMVVCDAADMQGYTAAYRQLWTDWFRARRGHIKISIYMRSKLVRMAIAVVNMAVGDVFETCKNEEALHATLSRLVPSFHPSALPVRLKR